MMDKIPNSRLISNSLHTSHQSLEQSYLDRNVSLFTFAEKDWLFLCLMFSSILLTDLDQFS